MTIALSTRIVDLILGLIDLLMHGSRQQGGTDLFLGSVGLLLSGVGLCLTVVTIVLAVVVHRSTLLIARVQARQTISHMWNTLNVEALKSSENLRIAEWLITSQDADKRAPGTKLKRRFFAFLALQAIHNNFLATKMGLFDYQTIDNTEKHLLQPLVSKEEIFELVGSRGFDTSFYDHCLELRKKNKVSTINETSTVQPRVPLTENPAQ